MNKNTAIKVQNLTKTYKLYNKPIDRLKESLHPLKKKYHKEFYALNNVSFEIKKGETVGIIGKNGSGKSTLLKIITGVLTPTGGRVAIHGKISAILELGAGFNPEMTGLENIYLNTSINGMNKAQTDKKIDEIVAFAELGEFIHQSIKTYSSGMKARLAFAVSINVEPDILIVDEALSVGDAAFARKCFAKMEEIRAKGATILFVSHSEGSIVSLCNRAIWISNGNQIIDGTPKLVTGLYMKHINENKIDKSKIEKEYEALVNSKDETQKEKISKEDNATLKIQNSTLKNSSIEEFFNPSLKPTSTIYYEEKGAKISDVKITTLDGKEVNLLTQGKEYIYSYKVNPFQILEKVQFGFLIKRKDGINLGGGAFPSKDKYLDILEKKVEVRIKFICSLNDGEYFFNCGVLSLIDNKIDYSHRIIDAYIIKVRSEVKYITGSINFIKDIKIKEIN
ncbi:ABC transporter ATP-binding protein [Aliarcobacter butzleri]|uniref:ABC transporter ATP-binding protein n=1 Tax=Aliarcobacter butzleri TaxID=28197 RepID=UPI0021B3FA1E|nr:ABC transporter ATP-binding protein [Aliarcobacter butzleri]MCT7583997.1 ABC transporter ATP-binding protein [Aliarcobacter butzleri]